MKKLYVLLLFLSFHISSSSQSLVINEIITSNSTVNTDDDGSYEDWVELYNGDVQAINLEGYGLTDNTNLFKWVFPAKTIQPGEYLLIWCSEKNRTNPDFPLHTNFKISADGETISLTAGNGVVVDAYMPVVIPQNYTYGRQPDDSSIFAIFNVPTPGSANTTTGYDQILDAPVFSAASGFYNDSFSLTISGSAGATILYTTDGSEPDENNIAGTTYRYKNQYPENPGDAIGSFLENSFITNTYSGPITITDRSNDPNKISAISSTFHANPYYIPSQNVPKGTVIRAKVIRQGALPSAVATHNYFVSPQADSWFSLPVIALNIDENELFDYEEGIYVAGEDFDNWRELFPNGSNTTAFANYLRRGEETEKKANFSFFNQGQEVVNQDIALRIQGGYTRSIPNKALRIYGNKFGNESLAFPFFGEDNDTSFKTVILRSSGNDNGVTYFLDAFIHKSVNHLNFDTQDYQPAVSFLNGEYWGIINLRERYDKHYFERVYGIDEDELDHLEIAGMVEAKEGTVDHYNNMIDFVTNNQLADQANYNYIKTQLDPENFADYYITEIFVDNTDWPGNNIELYRKRTDTYMPNAPYGNDGRWRWALKDTDVGFGLATSYLHNNLADATATDGTAHPNPAWATLLFRKMLESGEFRTYFINRFADLLNTTFLPSRMQAIYDSLKEVLAPEMPSHIDRWVSMGSMQAWNDYTNAIRSFAVNRPDAQRDHIRQQFNIVENASITLNVEDDAQGFIKINTININEQTHGVAQHPYPWAGVYFNGVPVTLKAIALPGYVFSHWTGAVNSTEAEITYTPTGDVTFTAHFITADVVNVPEPVYYWVFDGDLTNDTPLVNIDATFSATGSAVLQYQSCLSGYPFVNGHANWRKASMERRNSPTAVNYIPAANNDVAFADSDMKGLQIKQPFENNGAENTMVFNIPSSGFKDIKFAFALKDEGAANSVLIDYSVSAGNAQWMSTGIEAHTVNLTSNYQLIETDLSSVVQANDNANFKIRLRFAGDNMAADNGDRVTFNNISVYGTSLAAAVKGQEQLEFKVYPNPVNSILTVAHAYDVLMYSLFTVDGRLVNQGILKGNEIEMGQLQSGVYLLKISHNGKSLTKKIIKQ